MRTLASFLVSLSLALAASGLGATHTVLHDENGVIGTAVQGLTVRPRPA